MNPSSSNARLRPFRPVPFGRYTLLTQLGTGGMGEIFLARLEGMQGFEKLCVIKKILPQLAEDPEFVERFVGEARTLVKLSHGSIAQVLDMGLHEGEAYMALEHVDGKDLRKVAARARDRQMPLPLTFVLFVMGRVLDALAYAHRKKGDDEGELNLVHRDISPQNILISYEGEVKVIDFGLAKSRLSAAKTNPSIILGKFLYMSPEQARHLPVDRRSDLYAVGLCLYELLSGKNPFDALPPGEMMSAVAHPNIPPLAQVAPSVPASVSQLVMKALAVDPTQRFQAAEELRGRLNACLLELDSSSGPEGISRFMHELFASEYLTERRTLVMLREVGRVPEPEPEVLGMPEGAPPRPVPLLPPKTIRLDGPVEPLSFKPTPRTREGAAGRDAGETRPGVALEEPTSPDAVVDEPTRPAVPLEAIEESRRERPSGSLTPTLEEVVAVTYAPRPPPEDAPPRIEDTPGWSTALPSEEPRAAAWGGASSPPMLYEVPEEAGEPRGAEGVDASAAYDTGGEPEPFAEPDPESVDVRLDDTQPRIQLPAALTETTQPRVSLRDVYHEDTQPRVVLDESLLRDTQEEEEPSSVRGRPTGSRAIPRRRVSTTGTSRSTGSRGALTGFPDDGGLGEDYEERTDEHLPAAIAQRAIQDSTETLPARPRPEKRRSWVPLALAVLGAVGIVAVGAAILFQRPVAPPPPPPPPTPLARATVPAPSGALVPPPSGEPLLPEGTPPAADVTPVGALGDAGVTPDAGEVLDAGVTPDAGAESSAAGDDQYLLFPLATNEPGTESAHGKASSTRRARASSRGQTELQKEWGRVRAAYTRLTRDIGCANLDLLCSRYESLEAEVERVGDAEDGPLLLKVRQLLRDINKKKSDA